MTAEDVVRIQKDVQRKAAERDRLLDEYLAIPERPVKMVMMAPHSFADSRQYKLTAIPDYDHFCQWMKQKEGG